MDHMCIRYTRHRMPPRGKSMKPSAWMAALLWLKKNVWNTHDKNFREMARDLPPPPRPWWINEVACHSNWLLSCVTIMPVVDCCGICGEKLLTNMAVYSLHKDILFKTKHQTCREVETMSLKGVYFCGKTKRWITCTLVKRQISPRHVAFAS